MAKKIVLGLLSLLTVGQFALALPLPAAAQGGVQQGGQEALNQLGQTGLGGSTAPTDAGKALPVMIGKIIRAVLGVLGVLFLVLVVYAGFLWMIARGDAKKVDDAKNTMIRAVIGMAIIFLAWAISGFVLNLLIAGTTP